MSGDVRNWKLDAGLGVKAPGTPSATAGLKGRGTLTSLTLDELTAKTAGGTGRVTGEITWVDALRWRGDMKLANLDVSHFAPSVKAVLSAAPARRAASTRRAGRSSFPNSTSRAGSITPPSTFMAPPSRRAP